MSFSRWLFLQSAPVWLVSDYVSVYFSSPWWKALSFFCCFSLFLCSYFLQLSVIIEWQKENALLLAFNLTTSYFFFIKFSAKLTFKAYDQITYSPKNTTFWGKFYPKLVKRLFLWGCVTSLSSNFAVCTLLCLWTFSYYEVK